MRLVRRIFDREISIRDFYFDSVVKWCLQMTNYDSFLSYEKSIQSLKSLITRKQFSPRRWWRQKDIRFWSVNNLYTWISLNPYWQITETKSKTWEFTERHLRKQNPKNFQKFHFGNVTERHLRKQNPDKNTEYLVIIFIFLRFLGSSPSVIYGNKIQWNFPKES